jgi:hypothetical protein
MTNRFLSLILAAALLAATPAIATADPSPSTSPNAAVSPSDQVATPSPANYGETVRRARALAAAGKFRAAIDAVDEVPMGAAEYDVVQTLVNEWERSLARPKVAGSHAQPAAKPVLRPSVTQPAPVHHATPIPVARHSTAPPHAAAAPAPQHHQAARTVHASRSLPAQTRVASAAHGGHTVWVNSKTGVYHNSGCRWYGNTAEGHYGNSASVGGRACSKCGG